MTRMVALLRAVNVGGTRKLPMADLRTLCGELGFTDVATYIQSGNLVLTAPGDPSTGEVERTLERAIEARFGLVVPVVARTAAQWSDYAAGSPFPEAEMDAAGKLMLVIGAAAPKPGAAEALAERGTIGERIVASGDALWVFYPEGAGQSKLTPAMFDRMMGGAATSRNWNTVRRLHLLAGGAEAGEG